MSVVNTRDKTILTKIVYYGPALGGKTTSLQHVHATVDPDQRTKLVSLRTDAERTLFFDFLPIEIAALGGYRVRIQAFTVPGQVKYNLTRRYVLIGADAVVFVADSSPDRMNDNVESLESLESNLRANDVDLAKHPLVFQWNKRDLAAPMPVADMAARLNPSDCPAVETSAVAGAGVFAAFTTATRLMLDAVAQRYRITTPGASVGEQAAQHFAAFAPRPSA